MDEDTESVALRFKGLDTWDVAELLEALWGGQSRAVAACVAALPSLGRAVEAASRRLAAGDGRLVYAGAGASGLIVALDALELEATFDWPRTRTAILLAGGLDLSHGMGSRAEDDANSASARARDLELGPADVVLAASAGGASAFTVAIVQEARRARALTVAFTCVANSALGRVAEHVVIAATGAEVIAGSTRLGAGTAQKVLTSMFSTALMVRLGFVFDNYMVNLRPENAKGARRGVRMVASIARVDENAAAQAFAQHGDIKRAVLGLAGLSRAEVETALGDAGGNMRTALARLASRRRAEP
ncbi:MAG TPA: N-acetylmuramic acid 6-phosphate etherase [Polyangiaceae bacterium]|nr:N-acetylmuramic acid 6-phosphate etherase [Polyangiaceae bacterium]